MERLQSPVYSDDEVDVVGGQSHRGEHNDHGDEPRLWDASRPDAGRSGCDAAEGTDVVRTPATALAPTGTRVLGPQGQPRGWGPIMSIRGVREACVCL